MKPENLASLTQETIGQSPNINRIDRGRILLETAQNIYEEALSERRNLIKFWSSIPGHFPKQPTDTSSQHQASLWLPVGPGPISAQIYGHTRPRQFYLRVLNLRSNQGKAEASVLSSVCLQFYAGIAEEETDCPEFKFIKHEDVMATDWQSLKAVKCVYVADEGFDLETVLAGHPSQAFSVHSPATNRDEVNRRKDAVRLEVDQMKSSLEMLQAAGFDLATAKPEVA